MNGPLGRRTFKEAKRGAGTRGTEVPRGKNKKPR